MTWYVQFNALLCEGQPVRQVDDHVYSVLTESRPGSYDKGAWLYDLVVGGRAYNRHVWGCPIELYTDACASAIAGEAGPIVDVGCGSLVFTAEAYAQKRDQLIVVVDMSIAMLRRARDRLRRIRGKVPDNIVLLQADATRLPFTSQSFSRTLSWGVLHVMSDRDAFIDELNRVTRYDGAITLSSLVIDRPFGHRYLKILERTGEVSGLLSSSEVQRLFARHGLVARTTVQGNMAFLTSP